METNEAFSLSEVLPLRLVTLISLILFVPLLILVSIVQLFELSVVSLELLSFFEQEMRERLKNADRKMKTILFIIQLITKVKYYDLVLRNPNL